MASIISRYIVREVVLPFCLALLLFTFLMLLPPIMNQGEELIRIGVGGRQVAEMLVLLVPQSLAVTIPMALLLGVLMGLGRMSGDRETVAMQACGISLLRILTPLLMLGAVAAAINCHLLLSVVPDANQRFREILLRVQANRAEGEVKPRVFYVGDFPDTVLYVQEVSNAGEGWSGVFLADVQRPRQPDVYLAERGRVAVDRDRQTVAIVLENGERHRVDPAAPDEYEVHAFEELRIQLDTEALFPAGGPDRGLREMTLLELGEQAAAMRAAGVSPHAPIMEAHKKFSIPVACFVFVLLGVGFGVSNRRDGRVASFALGIAVIFAYYVLMYQAEALAKGQQVPPQLAMWLPNILLGAAGAVVLLRRARSIERGESLPWLRRARPARPAVVDVAGRAPLVTVSGDLFSGVTILDRYVAKMYLHWVAVAFVGLLGIFYITTFIDLSDKLFKEEATGAMLLRYFWYATPQFIYYVLPISGLVATLVTVGLLTRTSELTVMKACGISLYRAASPILCLSVVWSVVLFGLGETVLARANRTAETLNREIRTGRTQTVDLLNRQWLYHDGVIYHYRYFDADRHAIDGLSVYELDSSPWSLARRIHATHARHESAWLGQDVWSREFATPGQASSSYRRDGKDALAAVAAPAVFAAERTDAELMNFRELERYIVELRARGFDVVELVVELHRKASFPFITIILALIAVPFAVTTGAQGALYGVGVGIVLAFAYWSVLSVFGALGGAGVLMPATAAWAPNLIFGASAGYFLLTVRT
ncbi:MAG: LPS export ABC transporter permease LptF [Acidobacteria bacterium]|nr:LPS export ABC transporter permease LptF [Acidobacteriota bacterium]